MTRANRDPGLWYPISSMRRANVAVEVQWSWWVGSAALIRQKNGSLVWCTSRNGEIVPLPEDKSWPPTPYCWRPVEGSAWPDLLPEPLQFLSRPGIETGAEGRVSIEVSPLPETERRARDWWHADRPALRLSTQREAVEYRLLRALAQIEPLMPPGLATLPVVTMMLTDAQREAERDRMSSSWPRFKPLPADVDDFVIAMGWFARLNPPERWHKRRASWSLSEPQRILCYRSALWPFDQIAQHIGMKGRSGPQKAYDTALDRCWKIANGLELSSVDHIATLRERNRLARAG